MNEGLVVTAIVIGGLLPLSRTIGRLMSTAAQLEETCLDCQFADKNGET